MQEVESGDAPSSSRVLMILCKRVRNVQINDLVFVGMSAVSWHQPLTLYTNTFLLTIYITFAERPAKVAKRGVTQTKPNGATTGASRRDVSFAAAGGLSAASAATQKAGVATSMNATATPRANRQQPMTLAGTTHDETTAKRPPMVSPELTFVPVPPSVMMLHHQTTMSSNEKQQQHPRGNQVSIVYTNAF